MGQFATIYYQLQETAKKKPHLALFLVPPHDIFLIFPLSVQLRVKGAIGRVHVFADSFVCSRYDSLVSIKSKPFLCVMMIKLITHGFYLLDVASIDQDTSERPGKLGSCPTKK